MSKRTEKTSEFSVYRIVCLSWLCLLVSAITPVLAQKTTINYCIDPNWLPYEAAEDNQHIGMSSDYLKILSANTNYQFNWVKTSSWEASLEALKSGQCELLPMLNQTPDRDLYLDFSVDYFNSPNFLVSTNEQPFLNSIDNIGQKTLGLIEGYRIEEYINTNFPDLNTISFTTEADGLQAVSDGKVDFFIGSVHSINNQIQALGLSNLKLAGSGISGDALRMGVAKGQQQLLHDINQALAKISKQQHFEIYNRWNDVKVIDHTNYRLVWQISLGGLLLVLILMIRYFTMRRYNSLLEHKNAQLNELQDTLTKTNENLKLTSHKDALTQLYNRHYFNHLVENKQINQAKQGPVCLIFLDLDHFKQVNDMHGHVIGDQVLKEFGHLLIDTCNNGELVGRWGGEEFLILKKQADIAAAEQLCVRIQQRMELYLFKHQKNLTCSFGIAQMRTDETLMACFERADQMLYEAKHQGRNRICKAS